MTDTDTPRVRTLYPLNGTPCVVCGYPAARVVRTATGTATAHYAPRDERPRICQHPPTGRSTR